MAHTSGLPSEPPELTEIPATMTWLNCGEQPLSLLEANTQVANRSTGSSITRYYAEELGESGVAGPPSHCKLRRNCIA